MFTYSYEPEFGLYAIIDPEGYPIDYEIYSDDAADRVKKLNENKA